MPALAVKGDFQHTALPAGTLEYRHRGREPGETGAPLRVHAKNIAFCGAKAHRAKECMGFSWLQRGASA